MDQEARVGEQGAGKGNQLALADVQHHATPLDRGLVARTQAEDKLVRTDRPSRGFNLGLGGVEAAKEDILADTAIEQERIVEHHAHMREQAVLGHHTQIITIDL